ncbi:MAG TPA: phosphatidylserine decarboxylase family protein [Gammaproteobacteria bacterium]|jgi:phosphatidylserine decarboxylase|nr:phosphatidylserine decarboxylase family protein [Gammaproteobacteria bacterium]
MSSKVIDEQPIIAREGWPFLAISVLVSSLASIYAPVWVALVFWVLSVFVLQFFRDPVRSIPQGEGLIVAPADGRVIWTGITHDPFLDRNAIKVSIFMNVFNVHSNRSPVDGVVANIWYRAGSFLNADLDKASEQNERNALHLQTASGEDITCVQVAGLIARRILCYVQKRDSVESGQRFGFIRFGSRVDVYLPTTAKIEVELGNKTVGGESIIAQLAS